MSRPWLSVIVPTVGRPTLEALLASIRAQASMDEVEVLVVADTNGDGLAAGLEQLEARCAPFDVVLLRHDAGYHAFGHPQRTYGQQQATADWLLFSQDDDALCVGAIAAIREALADPVHEPAPWLFRVDTWQAGVIWRTPEVALGNVDADCVVVPNDPDRLVSWGMGYTADYEYIAATVAAYRYRVAWGAAIIARGRPHEPRQFQSPPIAGYEACMDPDILRAFNRAYYQAAGYQDPEGQTWKMTRWLGVPVHKPPTDLLTYQQLIYTVRPRWIVETGTRWGGSALFFASICDLLDHGYVLTIEHLPILSPPQHERILYIAGDSVDAQVIAGVQDLITDDPGPVLVSLDSDHHQPHVRAELDAYAPLVTAGSYLVVEDTNFPLVAPFFGPGPAEALAAWLPAHPEFVPDPACEAHGFTFCPGSWLRRVG